MFNRYLIFVKFYGVVDPWENQCLYMVGIICLSASINSILQFFHREMMGKEMVIIWGDYKIE